MAEAIRGSFRSVTGQELEKRLWPAEGQPKAVVQFVHGMAEHIDRYDAPAKALNQAGFIVVGHTHLGHGQSAAVKGYFADKDGWDALIEDTNALRRETQAQYPDLPYFLLGHSMGSFVARTYCLKYEEGLAEQFSAAPAILERASSRREAPSPPSSAFSAVRRSPVCCCII